MKLDFDDGTLELVMDLRFVQTRFEKLGVGHDGETIRVVTCDSLEAFARALGKVPPDWAVASEDGRSNIYIKAPVLWQTDATPQDIQNVILHEVAHIMLARRGIDTPFWVDEAFAMIAACQIQLFEDRAYSSHWRSPYELDSDSSECYMMIATAVRTICAMHGIDFDGLARHIYQTNAYESDDLLGCATVGEVLRHEA